MSIVSNKVVDDKDINDTCANTSANPLEYRYINDIYNSKSKYKFNRLNKNFKINNRTFDRIVRNNKFDKDIYSKLNLEYKKKSSSNQTKRIRTKHQKKKGELYAIILKMDFAYQQKQNGNLLQEAEKNQTNINIVGAIILMK